MPEEKNDKNKSLDGIKKLPKEEIQKARRVLLEYIGEEEKEQKKNAQGNKSMDGILGSFDMGKKKKKEQKKKGRKKETEKDKEYLKKELGVEKKQEEKKEALDSKSADLFAKMAEKKKIREAKKNEQEKNRKKQEAERKKRIDEEEKIKKQAELRQAEEQKKAEAERKNKEEAEKKAAEKKKKEQEEKKKQAKLAEKKRAEAEKERKRLEKIKKEEEEKKKIKKAEEKERQKKEKAKKRKEAKKRIKNKFKLYRHRLSKKTIDGLKHLRERKKRITLSILILFLTAILLYLLFVLLLVRVNPDNRFSRFLAEKIPVPVLFSSYGVLEYYDYIDKKNNIVANLGYEDPQAINKVIAYDLLLDYILQKHSISYNDPEMKEKLSRAILYDEEVNNVGIKRIEKIKTLINEGADFVAVSERFGDKVDKIDFSSEAEAVEAFGEKLSGLRIGQVSPIVAGSDGYYIFRRYKKDNSFSLSYVYIASRALDDYLNEEVSRLKIRTLVD